MVRVLLGGGVAANAGRALQGFNAAQEEAREAERREVEFQQNLRIAELQTQRAQQGLVAGALDLEREQDPSSLRNQERTLGLEQQRAGIDREQALAQRYRASAAAGTGRGSSVAGPNLIDPNAPTVRFLSRTRGQAGVEAYARLSESDRAKFDERVLLPGIAREDIQRRIPKMLDLEAQHPHVAREEGFVGTEALMAQFESGAISHEELVMAHEGLRIAVQDNAEVIAYGQHQLGVMQKMIGDPTSLAGVDGNDEDGIRALALSARLQTLLDDPTPDEEEIRETVEEFHVAAAHPVMKGKLHLSQQQVLELEAQMQALTDENQRLRAAQPGALENPEYQPGRHPTEEMAAGLAGQPLTPESLEAAKANATPIADLKEEDRPAVADALRDWLHRPETREIPSEEFTEAFELAAIQLGFRGKRKDLEELIQGVDAQRHPAGLPKDLDFSHEPDPYSYLGI